MISTIQITYNKTVLSFSFFIGALPFGFSAAAIQGNCRVRSVQHLRAIVFHYIGRRYSIVMACALVAAPFGSKAVWVFPWMTPDFERALMAVFDSSESFPVS